MSLLDIDTYYVEIFLQLSIEHPCQYSFCVFYIFPLLHYIDCSKIYLFIYYVHYKHKK